MRRADLIAAIAEAYKLKVVDVLPVQKGYRNESHVLELDDGFVNIILYKAEEGILSRMENANTTANILHEHGLPVRIQISPKIIQIRSTNQVQYGGLYNYLPGSTISWEAYTKDHLRSQGLTMANMHRVLSVYQKQVVAPSIFDEVTALAKRMTVYFAQPGVQLAMRDKLQLQPPTHIRRYIRLFEALRTAPNQHLLHMDFVRGNVLFSSPKTTSQYGYGNTAVSGIIDFEKTAYGPAVFDVARTLAFLLIDTKYKSEAEVRRYFLRSGYQKHGGGNLVTHYNIGDQSKNVLEILIDFFLTHDFYKFLLHNPYESLTTNEHFTRTTALLQQRGKLVTT